MWLRSLPLSLIAFTVFAAPAKPPNILFCIADDASWQHFSAYGCKWVNTPNFDRVAREGLLFERAYTPNAKCAPSRASVLTGRYSWSLESAGNHGGFYPEGYRTFMEGLDARGYFVGFTGKGWEPGDPGQLDGKPRLLTGTAYNDARSDPPTSGISPIDYAANFAEFLRRRPAGKPFCFWFGSREPHRAYEYGSGAKLGGKKTSDIDRIPPYWPDTEAVRNDLLDYGFEIEYFDRQLGRVLALLEQAGELDRTLIVVTSDNGMPFPRAKGTAYEIALHMPLAVRWPEGVNQPGRHIRDYVSFVDLAPTFLEVAGSDAAQAGMQPVQGRSLLRLLRDEYPGRIEPGREKLLLGQERHDVGRPNDEGYPVRGILAEGWLYLHNFEPSRWPMCDPITGYLNTDGGPTKTVVLEQNRAGINHWIWELDFGRRPTDELYHLESDPDCLTNVAADPANTARRERLQATLFAALKDQRDPRLEGHGEIFDRYPQASPNRDFYNRWIRGDRLKANWVEATDFEAPDFDPERPLAPKK